MVSNRKFGKIVQPYFSTGFKTYPVADADLTVELGNPATRMTATRILAGGVLAGPVGLLLGGMARKDVTKGRMTLIINGETVQSYEFAGRDLDKAQRFVEALAAAQSAA